MKYPQSHSSAGVRSKVLFFMVMGFAVTLLLSLAMVSLMIKWLTNI